MPNITILNGEETGKTYSWTADQIRIGRNSANDFVIANASVSGVHCIIERCESGWRVRDLDSTNGTRVNDQRVEMANVRRNDVITLGDIALSLRGDDVPESEPGVVESAPGDFARWLRRGLRQEVGEQESAQRHYRRGECAHPRADCDRASQALRRALICGGGSPSLSFWWCWRSSP